MNEMSMPPAARRALEILADPDNWIGDPATTDAELTGHDTPFELACEALADMGLKTVHFYGASDDLMEVEGDVPGCDEYNGEKGSFAVGGLRVDLTFGEGGFWLITVGPIDEDLEAQAVNVRWEIKGYSAHLYLDVPEGCYVSPLKKGS